jgi:hypothetical protein
MSKTFFDFCINAQDRETRENGVNINTGRKITGGRF